MSASHQKPASHQRKPASKVQKLKLTSQSPKQLYSDRISLEATNSHLKFVQGFTNDREWSTKPIGCATVVTGKRVVDEIIIVIIVVRVRGLMIISTVLFDKN